MSLGFAAITSKAEFLLLERSILNQAGPTFEIVHRFGLDGIGCNPGEEVFQIYLCYRGHRFELGLSLALRLLLNYLATYRNSAQSATQIAAGMRARFYREHGRNSGIRSSRKICRNAVKVYISRIKTALTLAFRETALPLRADDVLLSQKTVGNEVLYSLQARIVWVHAEALANREHVTIAGRASSMNLGDSNARPAIR